jgi:hypothetical protein
MEWQYYYCENGYATESNLQSQCNPTRILMALFTEKLILKIIWKHNKPPNSQAVLGKKEQFWIYSMSHSNYTTKA